MSLKGRTSHRTFRFPDSLTERLENTAERTGFKKSEIVRLGVREIIDELRGLDPAVRSSLLRLKREYGLSSNNEVTNR